METLPKVILVTVNFNSTEDTIALLDSLQNLNYPQESLEIQIVENASKDVTPKQFQSRVKTVKSKFPIKIIQKKQNVGLSAALNEVLLTTATHFQYIWRLDNDIQVHPDALKSLVTALEKDKTLGMAASTAFEYEERTKLVGGPRSFSWLTGINLLQKTYQPTLCTFMPGYSALVRTEAARQIGYLSDDRYFAYLEDIDFSYALTQQGWRVLFTPDSIVYHRDDPIKSYKPYILYLIARNTYFFIQKNGNFFQKIINVLYLCSLNNLLILYVSLKTGKFAIIHLLFLFYWKGLRDGFPDRRGKPSW